MTTTVWTTKGILPFIHNVSDTEIAKVIAEYRLKKPDDKRSDDELRAPAMNTVIANRNICSLRAAGSGDT